MPLAMQQVQRLQQRLIMTPQMQQSVKLLQMNTLQLEALTQQELLENPFLEIEEEGGDTGTSSEIAAVDAPSVEETDVVHERDTDPESEGFELNDSYETSPEVHTNLVEENPSAPESLAEPSDSAAADGEGGAGNSEVVLSDTAAADNNAGSGNSEVVLSDTAAADNNAGSGNSEVALADPAVPAEPADPADPAVPLPVEEGFPASDTNDDMTAGLDVRAVEDQPEQFGEVDTDWAEVFEDGEIRNYAPPRDDTEERSFEETVAGRTSLYEMLEWQLRVSSLRGVDEKIGAYLIGCIDDNGYLQGSLEECAERFGVEAARVERVLGVIQDFDPTGVGARDLPECLRLQLKAFGELTPLAEEVLKNHWGLIARKKFKEIARLVKATEQQIQALFARIQKLQPAPGSIYSKEQPVYITPDVYVKRIGKQYVTYLNEGRVAHLHLNSVYKDILIRSGDPNQDPKAREYALDKYRSAVMFIKNVEKRRNTVLRVTEAIMDYQREFLERGVEALRPLSLNEIATRVGMHESTISRVTSSKYVDTPRGLFELKFFFSSAIESRHGEAASSRSIKQKIQELIAAENPKRPLSDDKIAKVLKAEGFSIARRTIAKYREQLKILPTNMRRQSK